MYNNTFNEDIDNFVIALESAVDDVLEYEVANAVTDIMIGEKPVDGVYDTMGVIGREVYSQYEPESYERRYTQGGLVDRDNIISELIPNENTLIVANKTEDDGYYPSDNSPDLVKTVEEGVGYNWEKSKIYKMQPFPRPFHEVVEQEITRDSTKVDSAMVKGLNLFGFEANILK